MDRRKRLLGGLPEPFVRCSQCQQDALCRKSASAGALESLNWTILSQSVPDSGTWWVEALIGASQYGGNNTVDSTDFGLYLYNGTKLLGIECLIQNTSGAGPFGEFRVEHITNVNTDGSTVYDPGNTWQNMTGGVYLRWYYDGTYLIAQISPDGQNWLLLYQEGYGDFINPLRRDSEALMLLAGAAQTISM